MEETNINKQLALNLGALNIITVCTDPVMKGISSVT